MNCMPSLYRFSAIFARQLLLDIISPALLSLFEYCKRMYGMIAVDLSR